MLVAALLVVPAIAIEQSEAGGVLNTIAVVINWATWLAFLADAVLMLSVVDDRWRWIRDHPLEVAIVLVTPPFLPPSLQVARVFRLLRLLPLLRAGLLARRLLTTEGVRDVGVLAVLTVLGGGAAYAAVEDGPGLDDLGRRLVGDGDRDHRRLRRYVPRDRRGPCDCGRGDARGHRVRGGADGRRRRAVHART
jgi:hypothetical protein